MQLPRKGRGGSPVGLFGRRARAGVSDAAVAASVKGLGGLSAFGATVALIAPGNGHDSPGGKGHHWRDYRGTGSPANVTTLPRCLAPLPSGRDHVVEHTAAIRAANLAHEGTAAR